MIKIPRNQTSQIKDVLFPDNKKPKKNLHQKNIRHLREQEERNRIKKLEKENFIPPKPFKMKQFDKIPSKVFRQTQEWVTNEQKITEEKMKERNPFYTKRPHSSSYRKPIVNMDYQEDQPPNLGMFEKYYYNKLQEKNLLPSPEEENEYLKENIPDACEETLEEKMQRDRERQMNNIQNIEEKLNEQYESIKKAKLKDPTPKSNDKGMLLPKSAKNYLKENKQLIHEHKVPNKMKVKEKEEEVKHKDYGKTPNYIEKMKIEAEVRKELARRRKEEAKYPKGTRLLSEEERIRTLDGLYESQKEIIGLLEKLPISMRTMATKSKKDELERKLDEIEEAIRTFSRKQVFIKIDQ